MHYEHTIDAFNVEADAIRFMNERSQEGWEVVNVYHRYYQTVVAMRRALPDHSQPIHAKG